MRVVWQMLVVLGSLGGACAIPGMAQAQPAAPEESPPDQAWYPSGYRDLRIAAAAQVATFPRDPRIVLFEDFDNPQRKTYDVIDCNLGNDLPDGMQPYDQQLAALALDIARMRFELRDLGYKREVYDQPLLTYERAALADFKAQIADRERNPQDYRMYQTEGEVVTDLGWSVELQNWELLGTLAERMEARRKRLDRARPQILSVGGCGAGEGEFTIELVPANGELWLINAFAFRVCERKVPDPWDHRACGWNQYSAGDDTWASGRYMYEARWPDGTVKRGAKILQEDFSDDGDGSVVTFRRN